MFHGRVEPEVSMDKTDEQQEALFQAQMALLKGIKHFADGAVAGGVGAKPDTSAAVAIQLADAYQRITLAWRGITPK
jgi:hypothetical protein